MRASLVALLILLIGCWSLTSAADDDQKVPIPSGIDHGSFDRLLKKYVDERGLVDYAGWKENREDIAALDRYLGQYSRRSRVASGDERAAGLANLYNASMLRWILRSYPVESAWRTDTPFKQARHQVFGSTVSLDDIENGGLRPLVGYKAHAVLVCAARSCPPLQRFAYTRADWESQVNQAYAHWLAREDLNEYLPRRKTVEISSIFKWFADDFEKAGGVKKILSLRAPLSTRDFLRGGDYTIKYKSYDWGLNDQGHRGRSYGKLNLFFDNLF